MTLKVAPIAGRPAARRDIDRKKIIMTNLENVLSLVLAEYDRQNIKWGKQDHDNYHWLAILTEEVGELAQAILHDEFGGSCAGNVQIELIHVAAVAVQWLECIERKRLKRQK